MMLVGVDATESQTSPRVVIVGAGLAGLTTGYRLKQAGYDVHIYEARNRLGGRVFTINMPGGTAELGGHNVFDGIREGRAESILSLIAELGLEIASDRKLVRFRYFDDANLIDFGDRLEKCNFTADSLHATLQKVAQASQNMRDVLQGVFPDDDLLVRLFTIRLAGYEGVMPEHLSTGNIATLYRMLLRELSAAHQSDGEKVAYVDQGWVNGGNSLLVEKLAGELGNCIYVNSALIAIARTCEGSYTLRFGNGEEASADIVVLTVPCPVFRDIAVDASVLPQEKLEAIRSIVYGTNSKIIVPAEAPFPPELYTNGRVVTNLPGPVGSVCMYYLGNSGRFDSVSIRETFEADKPILRHFYSCESAEKVPVTARDCNFAHYDGPVGHCWPVDPYARGSYSCIAVGQEHLMTDTEVVMGETVKRLFAPVNDGTLFFAGEHTSILFDAGGTMEAAVESGERAARLIQKTVSTPATN